MKKETKRKLIEWLLSLGITLIMLGLVLGAQAWYTSVTRLGLDAGASWIGNVVGGIIMLFIVHHFIKKPEDKQY